MREYAGTNGNTPGALGGADLQWLILKSMFLEDWRIYGKTICYLVLVLSIMLILSSADRVRYDNQLRFLNRSGYCSVSEDVPVSQASFYVFQGEAALTEDVRGALICRYEAAAEIFLMIRDHPDFDHSPFTRTNLQKNNPDSLKEGEALISYDLSRRLHVRKGDNIMLFPWEGEGEITVRVAGIMNTKYRRGEIGYTGTILLRGSLERISGIFDDGTGVAYYTDETGSLSIEEEKRECRGPANLKGMFGSPDVLFPLSAFLLLGLVLVRECRRLRKSWVKRFLVLTRCGAGMHIGSRSICLMGCLLLVPSLWAASFLYRVVFMNLIAGEYMSVFFSLRQGIFVLAGSFFILFAASGEQKAGEEEAL